MYDITNMQKGVYDMPIEHYHASTGVSRSALVKLKKSRFHYWYEYLSGQNIKQEDTNSLIFGNLMHTMVLERAEVNKRYYVMDKCDRRTKAGKSAYIEQLDLAGNKTVITADMHFKAQLMCEAICRNEQAVSLLSDGIVEQSLYWTDPDTGILCKARPDLRHKNMVIDLKTTLNASPSAFQSSCYKYSYFLQAGMIQEALKHTLDITMDKFIYVAIEKELPHATAVYLLDGEAIAYGVAEFKQLLKKLKESQETNNWEAYETQMLTLPSYAGVLA